MTRLVAGAVLMSFACSTHGQAADGQPAFEVASIKPVPPPEPGKPIAFGFPPGSNDPGLYTCNFCNLSMLITQAYGVQRYQLSGPVSLDNDRFNITAKIPEGADREQVKLMVQNLLAERFKLAIHRERKDAQVYELVAKGGPKFKESRDTPPPVPGIAGGKTTRDEDGFPVVPGGGGSKMFMLIGRARLQAEKESMEYLARVLSDQVGKPVTDATGLKAKYDFILTWDGSGAIGGGGMPLPPPPPGGGAPPPEANTPLGGASQGDSSMPTIFVALESQLGLKLKPKKGQVETIVIDHVEKVPTEN